MFTLETSNDVEDLIVGTTILGTGGGGSPESGRTVLETDLKAGRKLRVGGLDEIPNDALIVSPYYVGSVAPGVKPSKKLVISEPFSVGLESLERHLKRKVAATVATELGGGNTAVALHVAAQLNIPIIDGDLMGRAGPELHQSTTHIFSVSMAPSVVVSETGDVVFIERFADIDDYEALARYVSILAGGHASVIDTPLTKAVAAKVLINGTIAKSMLVGRTVREANGLGKDPVQAVKDVLGGWLLFRGVVEKYEWRNEKGFLFGDVTVKGTGDSLGHTFRSWIKNEHIFAWLDTKPAVMPPDLIMFLDNRGYAITNDALKSGVEVAVLAAKAPDVWRSERGIDLFGPRHFGFDYDYVPVEILVKKDATLSI
jgi:DUF917 family protein